MPTEGRHPMIVELYYRGHRAGLYRARDLDDSALLLEHGAIAFPDDTVVDVRLTGSGGRGRIPARVVESSRQGMRLHLDCGGGLRAV